MTNNTTPTFITDFLLENQAVPESLSSSAVQDESGLVLVSSTDKTCRIYLINALISHRIGTDAPVIVSLTTTKEKEITGGDQFIFPNWNNQPELSEEYSSYADWAEENAGDAVDEMMEEIYDASPDILVIGDISNGEEATLAVGLARQGYLVIAGINGRNTDDASERLQGCLDRSQTFADYASGYEDVSGYNDGIVAIVLKSGIHAVYIPKEPADKGQKSIHLTIVPSV